MVFEIKRSDYATKTRKKVGLKIPFGRGLSLIYLSIYLFTFIAVKYLHYCEVILSFCLVYVEVDFKVKM